VRKELIELEDRYDDCLSFLESLLLLLLFDDEDEPEEMVTKAARTAIAAIVKDENKKSPNTVFEVFTATGTTLSTTTDFTKSWRLFFRTVDMMLCSVGKL
jgi:hypothetical protein